MKNKFFFLLIGIAFSPHWIGAQSISLEECRSLARSNYPLLDQRPVNEAITQLNLENLDLQKRLQLNWNAQVTYQSESVEVPFNLPNGERIKQPKFNGQTTLEATYFLYDGGRIEAAKQTELAQLGVQQQALEVELEKLKKQVNQLYFGIILSRAQDSILLQTREDLRIRLEQLRVGEREGIVLPSEVIKLQVELLRLETQRSNLVAGINRQIATLERLIGRDLEDSVELPIPTLPEVQVNADPTRAELTMFEQQKRQVFSRTALIDAQKRPQISAFVRAGAGYANPLNFFDTDLSPFALGGVQFRWNILDWGKREKDKQLLQLQAQRIEVQKATFLHNLDLLDGQYIADENKLHQLLEQGEAIQLLQEDLLTQTASQLKHGIATANDYLIQSNAITQTKLNQELYRLQLLQLKVDYLTDKGLM